jgi:hypothetical protein
MAFDSKSAPTLKNMRRDQTRFSPDGKNILSKLASRIQQVVNSVKETQNAGRFYKTRRNATQFLEVVKLRTQHAARVP